MSAGKDTTPSWKDSILPYDSMATKLIAVIHHRDDETTLLNARLAEEAGFEGVALIHMEGIDELIDRPAVAILETVPTLLVITNRLTTPPHLAIARDAAIGVDGSWADNPGIYHDRYDEQYWVYKLAVERARRCKPAFRFFSSVAFKTHALTETDQQGAESAWRAEAARWIPTTSGPSTGVAPDVGKLRAMRHRIDQGAHLAVASGVTPENAADISLFVDWIFVSTGISKDFHHFDAGKMKKLRKVVDV